MPLNQDCIRSLLLFIDGNMEMRENGRLKPLKFKHNLNAPELSKYSQEDLFSSAKYLVDKKLVDISTSDPKLIPQIAPRAYIFSGITPKGLNYLVIVKDGTAWNKLKTRFFNVFDQSIKSLVPIALELGIKLALS